MPVQSPVKFIFPRSHNYCIIPGAQIVIPGVQLVISGVKLVISGVQLVIPGVKLVISGVQLVKLEKTLFAVWPTTL